jgi:rhamnose utilization protein RhaD (predicted bifunctional aldolase and dehydrogenase)
MPDVDLPANIAPSTPADFWALRQFSAALGSDIMRVQGPGGNVSVKHCGLLWIKASGTWLADAVDRDIFIPLKLAKLLAAFAEGADECAAAAVVGSEERRPSIESAVHAVLPHRVIAHVHCIETIRWAVLRSGEREIARRLSGKAWQWVPYRQPGVPLAREIVARIAEGPMPSILVLENHGLIIGGQSCDEVADLLDQVRTLLATKPRAMRKRPSSPPARAPIGFRWTEDVAIVAIAFDPIARAVARSGVLYPDHAVLLGVVFPEVREGETVHATIDRWRAAFGGLPHYIVVPSKGVLVGSTAVPSAVAMLRCLAHVTARIASDDVTRGNVRYLSESDVDVLMNWDAESYRRKLAALE